MIPETFVINFLEKTKAVSEEIKPSFFELTFVMALDYFAQEEVEVAIIETGLGGRLDSTNVITPLLSVITNISYDHMDILGDTLGKIAFEKAGIIKPNIPVVIGESTPETKTVFQTKSNETQSPIFFAEEEYNIHSTCVDADSLEIELLDQHSGKKENYQLDLNGIYQEKNLLTVLTALHLLKEYFSLKEDSIKKALSRVKKLTGLHGRWEVIHKNPLVVLDVAHNEGGMRQLIQQINQSTFNQLHVVFGMVKDKDPDKVLNQLPTTAKYYFTKAQIPRALEENDLQKKAATYHLNGDAYPKVSEALEAALLKASKEDMIIVCGSVFVVGEATI
jgi:dihydrofolate synthase/folylpolyglutamate synthase